MNHRSKFCLSFALIGMIFLASFNSYAQAGKYLNLNSAERSPSRSTAWDIIDTITTTVQIDAGENYYIYFDSEAHELVTKQADALANECNQAINKVPDWLKDNLTYKFRQLTNSNQIAYANLIINSPDPKYIDEIGFCIAHSSVESLQHQYMFPQLFTDNAKYIYQNDQYLDYVEIVEKTDHTTLSYKNETNVSHELPRDIYYWYVVHPKLSDEFPTYVDPNYDYTIHSPGARNYGVAPPTGKFWREWLFYNNDSANQSGNNKANPLLKELLSNKYTLWEAVSAINSWISKSFKFTSNNERPIQPVRIYRKHIGRCGEHQDMRNAAARAALIPSTCTMNSAEDHVWNEIWDARWIHWDGDCDNPMKYENGWGKKISSVWNFRGDGHIWSVTNRYSSTCTYTATVLDSAGLPVDGASVIMATENYYDPQYLTITTWGYTDYTGKCTIELGDERNYWSATDTDNLGEDPPDVSGNEQVTTVISNSAIDNSYAHTFNLPSAAPRLTPVQGAIPNDPLKKYRLDVNYEVESNILQGECYYSGEHCDLFGASGNIDFFIADFANFSEYTNNRAFSAFHFEERNRTTEKSLVIPTEDAWYAVLSNEFAQRSTKIVNITVKIYGSITAKITAPHDNSNLDLDSVISISGTAFSPLGLTEVKIDIDNLDLWFFASDTSPTGSGPLDDAWSTWNFDWNTKGSAPGSHNIRVKAADPMNTYITSINVTLLDVSKPELKILQPLNNSEFRLGEVISITGTVNDNVGVAGVQLIFDADLDNIIVISTSLMDPTWSYELQTDGLVDGIHEIAVLAYDTANNLNSTTIQINLLEIIAPIVTFSSPFNNSISKLGDMVYLEGLATDNKGVTLLELKIDDDEPINITSNIIRKTTWYYDWDTNDLSLTEGMHSIEVIAFDAVHNTGSATIYIGLDDRAPEVSITDPLDNEIFSAGDVVMIKGTVVDDLGLATLDLLLDEKVVSSLTLDKDLLEHSWSFDKLDTDGLRTGKHIVTVRAADLIGSINIASVTIIIDASGPLVEISEITYPILIGEEILLEGTASDDIEVVTLELIIAGNEDEPINITSGYSSSTDTWSYTWKTSSAGAGISEGMLEISVRATDVVNKNALGETYINLISLTTDTDADGMPDWWEMQYSKLDPNNDDANRDYDKDGVSNLDEYLGDDGLPDNDDYSDPNDKSSTPYIKDSKPQAQTVDDSVFFMIAFIVILIIILLVLMFLLFKKEKNYVDGKVEVSAELESSLDDYPPEEPRTPGPGPSPDPSLSIVPQTPLDQVPPHLQTLPQQQTSPLFSPRPMAPQPEGKIQLNKPPQYGKKPAKLLPDPLFNSTPALPPAKEN